MELLTDTAGLQMIHVPYKGAAPANNDLVSGQVQSMLNNLLAGAGLVRAKKLKILAITSGARSPALPDVPTIKELGFPNYEVDGWYGVFLPAKTPNQIVQQLSIEIAKALKDPEIYQQLKNLNPDISVIVAYGLILPAEILSIPKFGPSRSTNDINSLLQ